MYQGEGAGPPPVWPAEGPRRAGTTSQHRPPLILLPPPPSRPHPSPCWPFLALRREVLLSQSYTCEDPGVSKSQGA